MVQLRRLHNADDDANNRMSAATLSVGRREPTFPPCFRVPKNMESFAKESSRADRLLRGAYGGRVEPETVVPRSRL